MRIQRSTLRLLTLALLAAVVLSGCRFLFGEKVEPLPFDVIVAPKGEKDRHWWETVEYKKGVDMTGKKLEFIYLNKYVLVDYIKYVNTETDEEIVWYEWDSVEPAGSTVLVPDIKEYKADNPKWAIRTDHMGATGGKSLHAMANMSLPNILVGPELEGTYDIYFNVRAADYDHEFGVRIVEVKK